MMKILPRLSSMYVIVPQWGVYSDAEERGAGGPWCEGQANELCTPLFLNQGITFSLTEVGRTTKLSMTKHAILMCTYCTVMIDFHSNILKFFYAAYYNYNTCMIIEEAGHQQIELSKWKQNSRNV